MGVLHKRNGGSGGCTASRPAHTDKTNKHTFTHTNKRKREVRYLMCNRKTETAVQGQLTWKLHNSSLSCRTNSFNNETASSLLLFTCKSLELVSRMHEEPREKCTVKILNSATNPSIKRDTKTSFLPSFPGHSQNEAQIFGR